MALNDVKAPYNVTLNTMNAHEKRKWSEKIIKQLKELENIKNTHFTFLAGNNYRKYLLPFIPHYEVPLKGLDIGKQLQVLKQKIEGSITYCEEIHLMFNQLKRHTFPFDVNEIPKNGIYVLFEKGELCYGHDRIVRIGTHTGANQLRERLKQHFLQERKDRSIFRKNIGRAFLNKDNDDFLKQWNWDLTSRKNKEEYENLLDKKKQDKIEKKVSSYMQDNFSFVVFEVPEKDERLRMESKIISTVFHCKKCQPSSSWLGNYSPDKRISSSGLWQVQGLNGDEINQKELNQMKSYLID